MVAEELYGEQHHPDMQLQNKVGIDITEIPAQTNTKLKKTYGTVICMPNY